MTRKQYEKDHSNIEEGPPFFKSWNAIYRMVIAVLVLLILLFYWFSVSFS
jgi:hypothetical protein